MIVFGIDTAIFAENVFALGMLLMGILLIGAVLFMLIRMYLQWKKYNYLCLILEKDGFGSPQLTKDSGGIFVDNATRNKRFFLRANNVGLSPDNIPYLPYGNKRMVFLKRIGLKNFIFISFAEFFNDGGSITVGEEDVNWAINSYERAKKVYGTTLLQQLLPYIGIALMGVFILGMLVIVFQKIGVLQDVAIAFRDTAKILAEAKSGTTIVTGTP
jgi:hypothetical protein